MQSKIPVRRIALSAVVAAMYTALGYFSGIFGMTFGPVQCRFSEALTVLPFLFPETVWGLTVGCALVNLLSMYGLPDIVFGSLATLIAGLWTAKCRNRYLAPLPPVICNGLIVSAVIAYAETGLTGAFVPVWLYNIFSVSVGEAAACYALGLLLLAALERTGAAVRLGGRA